MYPIFFQRTLKIEDSGSDLSDFDGDSLISTLMSEISIDVNAASDNAIQLMGDSDSIPLLRKVIEI